LIYQTLVPFAFLQFLNHTGIGGKAHRINLTFSKKKGIVMTVNLLVRNKNKRIVKNIFLCANTRKIKLELKKKI